MENGNILVLSERQIMSVLDMPAALESVETSLREIAEGRCINPMKLHMSLRPGIQGYILLGDDLDEGRTLSQLGFNSSTTVSDLLELCR